MLRNHDSFGSRFPICHWTSLKSGHYRRYGSFSSPPLPGGTPGSPPSNLTSSLSCVSSVPHPLLVLRNHDSFDRSNWICHWRFSKSGHYRRYVPFLHPLSPGYPPVPSTSSLSCVSFAIHPLLVLRNHDSFDRSNWICHWRFPKSGHYRRYGLFSSPPIPKHQAAPGRTPPTWSSSLSCISFATPLLLVLKNHDTLSGPNPICHWGFPKSGHYRRYGPFS